MKQCFPFALRIVLATVLACPAIWPEPAIPGLTSSLSCGCVDSRDQAAPYEIEIRSEVRRSAGAWHYRYDLTNKEAHPITVMAFVVQGDRVEFVSSLMSDTVKDASVPSAKGPLTITVPPHVTRSLMIADGHGPIETSAEVRVLDGQGAIYGGGTVSLYVPKWPTLFVK